MHHAARFGSSRLFFSLPFVSVLFSTLALTSGLCYVVHPVHLTTQASLEPSCARDELGFPRRGTPDMEQPARGCVRSSKLEYGRQGVGVVSATTNLGSCSETETTGRTSLPVMRPPASAGASAFIRMQGLRLQRRAIV